MRTHREKIERIATCWPFILLICQLRASIVDGRLRYSKSSCQSVRCARLSFESHIFLHAYVDWHLSSSALGAKIRGRGQIIKMTPPPPWLYCICVCRSGPLQISHDDSFCQPLKLILRFIFISMTHGFLNYQLKLLYIHAYVRTQSFSISRIQQLLSEHTFKESLLIPRQESSSLQMWANELYERERT